MMKNWKGFLIMTTLLILVGCAPNPMDVADAYAVTVQADQAAKDAELARRLAIQQARYEAARKEEAAAEFDKGLQTVIRFATFAAVMTLIAVAGSLAMAVRDYSRGSVQAAVTALDVKAHLIKLDPITRQYPLLLQSIGDGKFSLANPNTDSVLLFDTHKSADRLMVLAMARTQAHGSLARESRLSLHPGEVSRIDLSQLEVIDERIS